jgi:hypothetical protein
MLNRAKTSKHIDAFKIDLSTSCLNINAWQEINQVLRFADRLTNDREIFSNKLTNFFIFFQIFTIEIVRGKLILDDDRHFKVFNWNVPISVQNLYKYVGFFIFGSACCQLTTEIAKYSIGRLRPHFISVSYVQIQIYRCSSCEYSNRY